MYFVIIQVSILGVEVKCMSTDTKNVINNEITILGMELVDKAYNLAEKIFDIRSQQSAEYKRNNYNNKDDILKASSGFIEMIGKSIVKTTGEGEQALENWGEQMGQVSVNHGLPLDKAMESLPFYRKVISDLLNEVAERESFSVKQVLHIGSKLDPLLDFAIHGFSRSYVNHFQRMSQQFNLSLQELSVPVVPLFSGVAVLPLVGEIDTTRASILMESALQRSVELRLNTLIIDLSGIGIVDTMVAHHIFKLVDTLGLLGVKPILSGINPEVAQTAVTLNIKLERVTIMGNLQQAVESLGYVKI
jgi:rsbT co-antagonist protein RsbR